MAVEQITYKNIDPKLRTTIMFGLCLAMLVACFDGTIVGTCAPVIVQDLGGSGLYTWMITAYLLCETVMIPISGKMSDLYGRKPLFLIGLTLFTVGSIVAGMSTSMEMLIACRAVQGLGGGILIPVATAAVADLYAPEARARMQGILGAIFGVGSGVGPVIGGYLAEYMSWHWCFYIGVPMALISFALTIRKFPTPVEVNKPHIDYVGMAILSVALVDIILLLELGGKDIVWGSLTSILMALAAVVLVALFILVENRAVEPILSPRLINNKTVIMAAIFMFVFGIGMMGAMTYSSYFAIAILGLSTLESGIYSIAMVVGMMITAMSSGALLNKTGYKPWLISGPIITFISMYLMSRMSLDTTIEYYVMCLFILGFGLGCMMAVIMTAVQNSSREEDMGMTTSSVNLMRSIGCTMGTAIFTTVINSKIATELSNNLDPRVYDIIPHDTGMLDLFTSSDFMAQLMGLGYTMETIPGVFHDMLLSFANSVDMAFLVGGVIILLLVIVGIIFKAVSPEDVDAVAEARAKKKGKKTE